MNNNISPNNNDRMNRLNTPPRTPDPESPRTPVSPRRIAAGNPRGVEAEEVERPRPRVRAQRKLFGSAPMKRVRDEQAGDSDEATREVKRRKMQRFEVIIRNKYIPSDICKLIVLQEFVSNSANYVPLALTCRALYDLVFETDRVFDVDVRNKLMDEYKECVLSGDFRRPKYIKELFRLNYTDFCFQGFEDMIKTMFNKLICHYFSEKNLSIIGIGILESGNMNRYDIEDRSDCLNALYLIDHSKSAFNDSHVLSIIKKVLEYYFKNEKEKDLFNQAVGLLVFWIDHAIMYHDKNVVVNWVSFLIKNYNEIIMKLRCFGCDNIDQIVDHFDRLIDVDTGYLFVRKIFIAIEKIDIDIDTIDDEVDDLINILDEHFNKIKEVSLDSFCLNELFDHFNNLYQIVNAKFKDQLVDFIKKACDCFEENVSNALINDFLIANESNLEPQFAEKLKAIASGK